MSNAPLIIKRKSDDGTRIISVRIKEETLKELDKIAGKSNYSRNEIINVILSHGVKNIKVEMSLDP